MTYFIGTSGDDVIIGLNNVINGVPANTHNIIEALGGNDVIGDTEFTDDIYGGDGNDTIHSQGGLDHLYGGAGNDQIFISSSPADLINFTWHNGISSPVMDGGAGDDLLYATFTGFTASAIQGGDGQDTLVAIDLTMMGFSAANSIERLGVTGYDDSRVFGTAAANLLDFSSMTQIYNMETETLSTTGNGLIIDGAGGDDTITGTAMNDTIYGGADHDKIYGSTGNDALYGDAGNDTLIGGLGADTMTGGTGDDVFYVDDAGDVISDEAGTDWVFTSVNLTAGAGVEKMTGTSSIAWTGTGNGLDNYLAGSVGYDRIYGEAGNDTIVGGANADLLYGGDGNDVLRGDSGRDTMTGGAGNDMYYVDDAYDQVIESANAGVDWVFTSVQFDMAANIEKMSYIGTDTWFCIANGLSNYLAGGTGTDFIWGLEGDDTISGGMGDDLLDGNEGNDVLRGDAGADSMLGREGDDSYYVDNTGDYVFEVANQGTDTLFTSINLRLADNIEKMMFIGSGNWAGTGNDGANYIAGGTGNDTIDGGFGADVLAGGAGADTFVFKLGQANGDRIADFSHAQGDKIDLSQASSTLGGFSWRGTDGFSYIANELIYSVSGGKAVVQGDTNGDGEADFSIILTGVTALDYSDFLGVYAVF